MCTGDEIKKSMDDLSERVDAHITEFRNHEVKGNKRHDLYLKIQTENTEAVKDLSRNTKDIVEAWQAAEGVVKFGSTLGKFVKWLSGFAVLGGILHWLGFDIKL